MKFTSRLSALSSLVLAAALATVPGHAQTASSSDYVPARVTQVVDAKALTMLRGNTYPLALPQFDRGAAPTDLPMSRMLLVLQRSPEQETALRQMLDAQQDKKTASYHKWLTPEQFGRQFGPADADVQQVTQWLRKQGFSGIAVGAGRTTIEFSGTAGLVKQALHTEIHKYAVNGETHWANSSDPMIPSALLPVVAGIDSLNNFPRKPMNHVAGVFQKDKTTGRVTKIGDGGANPLFTFTTGSGTSATTFYAMAPYDFATIYNVLPQWTAGTPIDGTGQTIAIVGQTDINPVDFVNFRTLFGLPVGTTTGPTGSQYLNIIYNGPDPGFIGDEIEADLDTQWAGAVAKGATIDFVTSESTEATAGIDLSAIYIIDNNLAPVMSESYGACELQLGTGGNAFYNSLWEQAAAQGITAFVSAGDSGAAGCDYNPNPNSLAPVGAQYGLAASGLASTPYNIAVGGTDFNQLYNANTNITPATYWSSTNNATTQQSAMSYIPETAWNDTCTNQLLLPYFPSDLTSEALCNDGASKGGQSYGLTTIAGGGGAGSGCTRSDGSNVSSCTTPYSKPSWQTGPGVPVDNVRDTPDVSLFASNGFQASFYPICQQDQNADGQMCNLNSPYSDFIGLGGTSAASPSFAGILALVNQKTGERQGNANYVFYNLAAHQNTGSCNSSSGPASSCVFNDVTDGTNSQPCVKGKPNCTTTNSSDTYGILSGYNAGTGYDIATGLGSVNVSNLVNDWNQATFTATTATLTLTPTTLVHGATTTATVTVGSASGTPTGDVSINSTSVTGVVGNGSVGEGTLASGTFTSVIPTPTNATSPPYLSPLPGGTYNVSAHYAGDGVHAPSDSNAVSVTVSPENSTTTVESLAYNGTNYVPVTTAPYGTYLVRANVAGVSGQGFPTGTVSFTDNSAVLTSFTCAGSSTPGTCSLNSLGYIEDQIPTLAVGAHSFVATYSGDASFKASVSAASVLTITPASTTTKLTADQTSVSQTATVNLTATLASPSVGNAPTGTMTFFAGTTQIGTAQLTTNGIATLPVLGSQISTTSGVYSLTAVYGGDTNYTGSTSAAVAITVTGGSGGGGADFNVTVSSATLNIPKGGTSATDTLTVSAVNGFTGTVTFACTSGLPTGGSCAFSPASVSTSGSTTLTVTIPTAQLRGGGAQAANHARRTVWLGWGGGAALACVLMLGAPSRRRRWSGLLALMLFAAVAGAIGCGSGGTTPSGPTTTAGSYLVTVTATSGSLSHSGTATLVVQ